MNDRRQAPRWAEEVALNVAEMSLMAAALRLAAARKRNALDSAEGRAAGDQLDRSAEFYLDAERDAVAARQAVTT